VRILEIYFLVGDPLSLASWTRKKKRKEERKKTLNSRKRSTRKKSVAPISNPGQTNGAGGVGGQDRGTTDIYRRRRQTRATGSGVRSRDQGRRFERKKRVRGQRVTIRGTDDERVLRRERGQTRSHDNKSPVYPQSSHVTGEPAVMSGWRSCRFSFANAIFSARDRPKN
jgi:hypothetical protein